MIPLTEEQYLDLRQALLKEMRETTELEGRTAPEIYETREACGWASTSGYSYTWGRIRGLELALAMIIERAPDPH
jgi:hypothetical protein